ncbi:MAG: CbiX/SirB N-terminal domain-containing protein [Pseudomonadota bacterium]|nr:CbiX/SirB N-terminal domain-containing protein [Pseudomonadota bacterium]
MNDLVPVNALLLVAHGSRREASNREVRKLTDRVRERAAGRFDPVDCAFLEFADPDIPSGIETCISAGATQVTVVPYFLSAGRHVAQDIPAAVAGVRRRYPEVDIVVTPHLGAADAIADQLLALAVD